MISAITYGNNRFANSKKRLVRQLEQYGLFDSIKAYGPEDLDASFVDQFGSVLSQPRGAGYWIWKICIIKQTLERLNDGDFLVYMDAGCTMVPSGKDRFLEYIKMLKESDKGIISFQMPHLLEKWYTTEEVFKYFGVEDDVKITDSGQYIGTVLIMKKCSHLLDIIETMLELLQKDPAIITDEYNNKQPEYFRDHRHDQSIFSVLRKIKGSIVIKDETWFEIFGTPESLKCPIWATRIRC